MNKFIPELAALANKIEAAQLEPFAERIDDLISMIADNSYIDKTAAGPIKVYHYTEYINSIKDIGLLAPAKLSENEEVFASIIDNYRDRIKKVSKKEITKEVVLDYLDYSRALLLDEFYAGRNMIFAAFQKVPSGISKRHDNFKKNPCVEINLTKLSKAKKLKYVVVELPFADAENGFEEIDLERVGYFTKADVYSLYDKSNADGLLFATIPHLAIWVPDGEIEKEFLSFV